MDGLKIAMQDFFHKVYELVSRVPEGHVVTYRQIAVALGNPRQARTVGWAMRACPEDVPWHRVVNSQGRLSLRPRYGSFNLQRALLEEEGVQFNANGQIDLNIYGWKGL